MLGMLNVLEHYNLSTSDHKLSNKTRTALNQHRVIEAMKYGFAARTEIGDIHHSGDDAKSRRERIHYFSTKSWAEEVFRNMTDVRPCFIVILLSLTCRPIGHDSHGVALQSRL